MKAFISTVAKALTATTSTDSTGTRIGLFGVGNQSTIENSYVPFYSFGNIPVSDLVESYLLAFNRNSAVTQLNVYT